MNLQESIRKILREELDKKQKVFYAFSELKNHWVDDNDRSYHDEFFDNKDYEDFHFDNFYDMDEMFGHENSLFGTRGLPVGHPDRSSKSFDYYNKKFGPMIVRVIKNNDLQESIRRILKEENKKSGLLRAIEEDGLFRVMQDTGLSMGQIILKYDNLPREVFERFIKDYIHEDGYHQTDGTVQMGYEVEISHNIYVNHFYMKGDKVTVEIRGYNDYNEQTDGYIESLSNLTDEEIFSIVDDMTRNMEDNWD
jgi:hypothetical protein